MWRDVNFFLICVSFVDCVIGVLFIFDVWCFGKVFWWIGLWEDCWVFMLLIKVFEKFKCEVILLVCLVFVVIGWLGCVGFVMLLFLLCCFFSSVLRLLGLLLLMILFKLGIVFWLGVFVVVCGDVFGVNNFVLGFLL